MLNLSPLGVLALQIGTINSTNGFVRWLVGILIRSPYQTLPAAPKIAISGLLSVVFAAAMAAVVAFLFKLWRESVARRDGARYMAHGPRRSRIALVVWLFLFITCDAVAMTLFDPITVHLFGFVNLMSLFFFGSLVYVAVFLLLHLPAHQNHMPWRRTT